MRASITVTIFLQGIVFVLSQGGFSLDTSNLRLDEMAQNVNDVKGMIMGIAEYMQEMNKNIKDMQRGVSSIKDNMPENEADRKFKAGLTVDELLQREELAQKIEKLFAMDNKTKVEAVKQEMASVVQTNFIKMLAAILVTGPIQAQEKTPEIFRVMKNVLNGRVDFKPVVDRLPFLLRTSETNQFILLLKALRDTERTNNQRQFGGLEDLSKIIDAAGKFDLKQVSEFLKQIPELFKSINQIVEGVDEYF